jgi:hypothetical protein
LTELHGFPCLYTSKTDTIWVPLLLPLHGVHGVRPHSTPLHPLRALHLGTQGDLVLPSLSLVGHNLCDKGHSDTYTQHHRFLLSLYLFSSEVLWPELSNLPCQEEGQALRPGFAERFCTQRSSRLLSLPFASTCLLRNGAVSLRQASECGICSSLKFYRWLPMYCTILVFGV